MNEPNDTDPEIERIEGLLRELNATDAELDALPDDLFARIEAETTSDGAPQVVSFDHRRRFSPRTIALGAVAVAAIVIGLVAITTNGSGDAPTVVAGADLQYDPNAFDVLGSQSAAHVNLIDDNGTLRVEIDEATLLSPTGESSDLELWLIQPDADGNPADLVSLGLIDPAAPGSFEVPAAYDPRLFSVVDISIEPRDGVVTHSGRSILRAPLIYT